MRSLLAFILLSVTVVLVLLNAVMPFFPLTLAVPLAFLCLHRILTGSPVRESATRVYLMYFLMGLAGLLNEALEFRSMAVTAATASADTDSMVVDDPLESRKQLTSMLLSRLPATILKTLSPLLCGVAVYILAGGNGSSTHSPLNTSHLQQLNDLLQRAQIPEAAASLMQALVTQTDVIRGRSEELAQATGQAAHCIQVVGSQAAASADQFARLATQAASLNTDFQQVRQVIREMQGDIAGIRRTVEEVGLVIEDFAEIAASRILNFSDESALKVPVDAGFRGPIGPRSSGKPETDGVDQC